MINERFEAIEPFLKTSLYALLIISFILDIIVCCRRWLAGSIIYLELVYFLVQGFVPYDCGDFVGLALMANILLLFLAYATNLECSTVACTICLALAMFCQHPLLHKTSFFET